MLIDHVLSDIGRVAEDNLKLNYGDKVAKKGARALIKLLWLNFCRINFYVPVSNRNNINDRHKAICKAFNGHNHKELAVKFRISVQSIYKITKNNRTVTPPKNIILFGVINDVFVPELIILDVSKTHAEACASTLIDHFIENYPGISFNVSDSTWNRWNLSQNKQTA